MNAPEVHGAASEKDKETSRVESGSESSRSPETPKADSPSHQEIMTTYSYLTDEKKVDLVFTGIEGTMKNLGIESIEGMRKISDLEGGLLEAHSGQSPEIYFSIMKKENDRSRREMLIVVNLNNGETTDECTTLTLVTEFDEKTGKPMLRKGGGLMTAMSAKNYNSIVKNEAPDRPMTKRSKKTWELSRDLYTGKISTREYRRRFGRVWGRSLQQFHKDNERILGDSKDQNERDSFWQNNAGYEKFKKERFPQILEAKDNAIKENIHETEAELRELRQQLEETTAKLERLRKRMEELNENKVPPEQVEEVKEETEPKITPYEALKMGFDYFKVSKLSYELRKAILKAHFDGILDTYKDKVSPEEKRKLEMDYNSFLTNLSPENKASQEKVVDLKSSEREVLKEAA